MRALWIFGLITLVFGLGAYRAQGEWGAFTTVNVAIAGLAFVAAAINRLRSWSSTAGIDRSPLVESALTIVAVVWGALLVEGFARASEVRFDWTFEGRYEIAPATREALAAIEDDVTLTLYYADGDPRIRRSRILLEEITLGSDALVRERGLSQFPDDEDRFGIGSSNSVVVEASGAWELVQRPTEGAIFEALAALGPRREGVVYATVGSGEGDLQLSSDVGYSGLGTALQTEGYTIRTLPSASIDEIPDDARLVLAVAPERPLRPEALDALRRYLARGGALVAFLEPGFSSGIEDVLDEWGLHSPDSVVVDPASGPVQGDAAGLSPIAFNYSTHPVTRGLDSNRMTFFRRSRSFELRKPEPGDKITAVVHSSRRAWLHDDPRSLGTRSAPSQPIDARTGYYPLVATGRYERNGGETRIVAFGDSEFASNRFLRALYNLDLAMNAVHWSVRRDERITLRAKGSQVIQFPVPIQNSLRAFYGVGLLVPELVLLVGAAVWLRRRSA